MWDTIGDYGSKHTSQCLSNKPFVHTYTHITWNFRSYVDILHIQQLLYYQRQSLCGSKLHERANWRAMFPDTHGSFSDTLLSVYTVSLYIHCHMCIWPWCATICMTTKLMYLMTAYYTRKNGFTANDAMFYKSKLSLLHYMLSCLLF